MHDKADTEAIKLILWVAQFKNDRSLHGMVAFLINMPVPKLSVSMCTYWNNSDYVSCDMVALKWLSKNESEISFDVNTKTKKYQRFILDIMKKFPDYELEIYTDEDDLPILMPDLEEAWRIYHEEDFPF